jgi:hypothetical protein
MRLLAFLKALLYIFQLQKHSKSRGLEVEVSGGPPLEEDRRTE